MDAEHSVLVGEKQGLSIADSSQQPPQAVIAGFGLPGRAMADAFEAKGLRYSVIELNAEVAARCTKTGHRMVVGDARQESVLREAGVMAAEIVAIMVPSDQVVLEVVDVVRRLRGDVRLIARAAFTSMGMEMMKRGATEVIVAEQVVAIEAERLINATVKSR